MSSAVMQSEVGEEIQIDVELPHPETHQQPEENDTQGDATSK